ncbi:MAG TPA: hypothetical protein VFU04_09195 [Solirubrobacterales bacterium]|nr:hypothetical protein [Solirubrobacterales bacterium]
MRRPLLAVVVALIALLAAAQPAGAESLAPPLPIVLFEEEAEEPDAEAAEGEEGEEAEWCEEDGEEYECEEGEDQEAAKSKGSDSRAGGAGQCPLRSAKGHATLKKHKLKLTIAYTTNEPTNAKIQLRYGAAQLGSFKRHLGRSGTLRVTRQLEDLDGDRRSRLRVELDTEGAGCPSRRLVLFPK